MIPSLLSLNFYRRFTMTPEAEKFNGWAAIVVAIDIGFMRLPP